MMQVVLTIGPNSHPRAHHWVSGSGSRAEVVDQLMRHARKDMNLTLAEEAEIRALVDTWVPGDNYPLPAQEDHVRTFRGDLLDVTLTSRGEQRIQMIKREIDTLLAPPNWENYRG